MTRDELIKRIAYAAVIRREDAEAALDSFTPQEYLSAVRPGWVAVPAEPTDEMANAWSALAMDRIKRRLKNDDDCPGAVEGAKQSYRAMIAARPKEPKP